MRGRGVRACRGQVENIWLPHLVFSRCSFRWCHGGCEDRSQEILGEFTPSFACWRPVTHAPFAQPFLSVSQ